MYTYRKVLPETKIRTGRKKIINQWGTEMQQLYKNTCKDNDQHMKAETQDNNRLDQEQVWVMNHYGD